jgi:zinc transport system substrate-binding protein
MNLPTHSLRWLLTTLFVAGVVSCGREVPPPAREGKLRVLTSFLPVQSHTAAIAGDLAEVTQLLSADSGPHDFQLTPGVVKRLAEADVFVVNGAGLEDWLEALIANAARPGLVVVDVSATLPLTENPAAFADSGATEEGKNPHTWLDPVLAREQAGVILAALRKADPANAAAYTANAMTYTEQLEALDGDFRATLAPLANKNLVTFHDAFPYLAARYGLTYVGCISEFPEKDPPPQQLASLVDSIRSARVGVIFAETGYAPDLLVEIARQSGARVSQLDTLEVGTGHATAYLDLMKMNLTALRDAFAP